MLFKTIINHDKQFVVETSPISAALHQATPCSDSALWITFPASSRSRFSRASALSWRPVSGPAGGSLGIRKWDLKMS
jgi:hypothetical protein